VDQKETGLMKMFFDSSAFEGSFFMAVGDCFIGVA
jgi:hypothetical protein